MICFVRNNWDYPFCEAFSQQITLDTDENVKLRDEMFRFR